MLVEGNVSSKLNNDKAGRLLLTGVNEACWSGQQGRCHDPFRSQWVAHLDPIGAHQEHTWPFLLVDPEDITNLDFSSLPSCKSAKAILKW